MAQQKTTSVAEEYLLGSSVQPAQFTLYDGSKLPLGDVVAEAHKRTGATVKEWNALDDADREHLIADVIAGIQLADGEPAAPPKVAESSEPAAIEETKLIEMTKGGETLHVHPTCVAAHITAGWVAAD